MGDMGDIFRENKEFIKLRRRERAEKFIPVLKKLGAEEKSDGVWQIADHFCYPTKGFAMHKKTNKKCNLWNYLNKILKEGFTPTEADKSITAEEREVPYAAGDKTA